MIERGQYIVSIGPTGMGRAGYIQWRGEGMPLVDRSSQVAIGDNARGYGITIEFFAHVDDLMTADPPVQPEPLVVTMEAEHDPA